MHNHKHAYIEIADKSGEIAGSAMKDVKVISASHAFRRYNWLAGAPVRNVSGNMRGMVVSKNWAAAFHFAEDSGKVVEKFAAFASLAHNLAKSHEQIQRILQSDTDWYDKGARLSAQVSSVALRTAGGALPAAAHLTATALEGYCQIGGLVGLKGADKCVTKLQSWDTWANTNFEKVTDGENISLLINVWSNKAWNSWGR